VVDNGRRDRVTGWSVVGKIGRKGRGGGQYNNVGTTTLTDCTFSGNSAANGAGLIANGGRTTLTNCTVVGNTATQGGGGLQNRGGVNLTNCTGGGHPPANGGGLANVTGPPTLGH